MEPEKSFDLGGGPGKTVEREVRGGSVGVILDARGRPLVLPGERAVAATAMARWVGALELYEREETPA